MEKSFEKYEPSEDEIKKVEEAKQEYAGESELDSYIPIAIIKSKLFEVIDKERQFLANHNEETANILFKELETLKEMEKDIVKRSIDISSRKIEILKKYLINPSEEVLSEYKSTM
jgi:23S rRNA maturation mini-RNase III